MSMIRKALAALFGVVATWVATATATGGIAWDEWWGLLAAVGAAVAVFAIPNEPAWAAGIQKAIASLLGGIATWAVTALADWHITHDEFLGLVALVMTVYGTYQAMNTGEARSRARRNRAERAVT